jgi:phosphatidylglycerophosphatase A
LKFKDYLLGALATSGGLGLAPFAPGTFGTLGGVALAALVAWLCPQYYLVGVLVLALLAVLISVPAGNWAEKYWGTKDPGAFVLDEVAGYLVTIAWISAPQWQHFVVAFFLFRLTDIVKPWPARKMERLPGGLGIVMDDVMAGLWALAGILVLHQTVPSLLGL